MELTAFEKKLLLNSEHLPTKYWAPAEKAYSEGNRYYHNWNHALLVLCRVNNVLPQSLQFSLAALYHDAVYVVGETTNEAKSAQLMLAVFEAFPEISEDTLAYASNLITLTAKHGLLESSDVTEWQALFLDCDMVGLAEPLWETALEHEHNIRNEFFHVYTNEQVCLGRNAFLKKLLDKKSIFLSDYFKVRYETQARDNIHRVISSFGY